MGLMYLIPVVTANQLTAEEVARLAQDRDTGQDSQAEMRMRLYDRQGRVRERTMTFLTRHETGNTKDRILVRFTYPNDIRNTALLVWEHPDAEDERFLFLPALGRVRRITGAEKQESFVGSDLSYEDIGGRNVADYTYQFVEEDATWVAPDGASHPAWRIEAVGKDQKMNYPRSVSTILKEQLVLVHADIYNHRDEQAKIFEVTRLDQISGIWTVTALVMVDKSEQTRTELETLSIEYNVGLTEADFSRRRLEMVPGQ